MDLRKETERVRETMKGKGLLHTSAIATAAGLDVTTVGVILARFHRNGEVVRYLPRKTNALQEKLWALA
jgi:hypothetical protein